MWRVHAQTTMDLTENHKARRGERMRVGEKNKHAHGCVSAASDWMEIYWAQNKAVNKEVAPADISQMSRSRVVATLRR